VHPGIAEAQPGDAGAGIGEDRGGQVGEGSGAVDGIVAEVLDAEQAPVGGEADLWAAPRFSDSYYSCCQAACR
jgi:hypothetical protein